MSNTKHTPGPWLATYYKNSNVSFVTDSTGKVIFEETTGATETVSSNAALIATAPELLEALELLIGLELYRACGNVWPPKLEPLIVKAMAAIKKAKGEL